MRKIILVYGSISGGIVAAMFFISYPFMMEKKIGMDVGMIIGYTSMVLAMSLIFFAIRSYRDQHANGIITFGKALSIGLLMSLLAAVIYATAWEIFQATIATGFTDFYAQCYIDNLKAEGADAATLDAARIKMDEWKVWYANPLLRFLMTMSEILPVGVLVSLICAAIVRKKQIVPILK
jgi:hypothetical protein